MKNLIRAFLFLLLPCSQLIAQGEAVEASYIGDVLAFSKIPLDTLWDYLPNGNIAFNSLNTKNDWQKVNPIYLKDAKGKPLAWSGIGWFRQTFTVPDSLNGKLIALSVGHFGASEIYLDDKLVASFGDVFATFGKNKSYLPRKPFTGMLNNAVTHTLKVRYATHDFDKVIQPRIFLGFSIALAPISESYPSISLRDSHGIFSMSLYISFTLFFFLVYLFYPQKLGSLFSALLMLNFAMLFSSIMLAITTTNASICAWSNLIWKFTVAMAGCWQLLYFYVTYYQKLPRRTWFLVLLMFVNLLAVIYPAINSPILSFVNILVFLEQFRIIVIGIRDKRPGFWILATATIIGTIAFLVFIVDVFHLFSVNYTDGSITSIIREVGGFISDLCNPLMLSLLLAWEFGSSNRDLQKQLGAVQELSKENLEKELEKQQILATQNETLEKQVTERTAELEHKNRDLEIEAALEKIRSASLAMHHSNELEHVVGVFYEKLKELGLVFDGGTGIHLFTEGSKDAVIWVYATLQPPTKVNLPYDADAFVNNTIILDVWNAHDTGKHIFNKNYSFEEKNRYFNYVFKHNDFNTVPEEVRNFILSVPNYTASFIAEKHSLLGANSWTGQLFSEIDFGILKRVSKVFEQSYVRFLDLQKAEAQAREAQIEVALERVRSRAMAMQNSNELSDLIGTVYIELTKLDLSLNHCVIWIFDPKNLSAKVWMVSSKISHQPQGLFLPYSEHAFYIAFLEAWKGKIQSLWVYDFNGENKKTWDDYVFTQTELVQLPEIMKQGMRSSERVIVTASVNNFGMLSATGVNPLSETQMDILSRFGKVFDSTYTRFNDLKQAEALAERAHLDLIQIQTEKSRAEEALKILKATQNQLIQSEKLASLGELTAGIAHEIQNPLNFVNNFAEFSVGIANDLNEEMNRPDIDKVYVAELLKDLTSNQEKINHHGKRAASIVTGMLEHSRASTGVKEPTDINKLCDEYFRLAFHGLRAKDKNFNCEMVSDFDATLPKIDIIPQDIGRVILNLINNAFYAVNERNNLVPTLSGRGYKPIVTVQTSQTASNIEISIKDNGTGMSDAVREKVFQPFFTTKPTGSGTGLGLSLAYDIITKGHGGTLKVESIEGAGSDFIISLPI